MKAFDPDPGLRWLACLAHPDDELAVACWLRRLCRTGAAVHLHWCHSTDERRHEALDAAAAIGVPADRLSFGDFPDGGFHRNLRELEADLRSAIQAAAPDRIVCAALEHGHVDHDSVHYALQRVTRVPLFEFPEYWPYTPWVRAIHRFRDPEGEEILWLNDEEAEWKRRLARSYASQALPALLTWWNLGALLTGGAAEFGKCERLRLAKRIGGLSDLDPDEKTARSKPWRTWSAAVREHEASRSGDAV